MDRAVDLSADSFKLLIYFTVGEAQHFNAILLDDAASLVVVKHPLLSIVLRAV